MTGLRRVFVALVALGAAAVMFRSEISLALVNRGDDFLYRAKVDRAVEYYRRALAVDAHSAVAADRYAFFAQQIAGQSNESEILRFCSSFLRVREDARVRADRALANLKLRRYRDAETDFELAAANSRDPRDLAFAALSAARAGRSAESHRLWHAARRAGLRVAAMPMGASR